MGHGTPQTSVQARACLIKKERPDAGKRGHRHPRRLTGSIGKLGEIIIPVLGLGEKPRLELDSR